MKRFIKFTDGDKTVTVNPRFVASIKEHNNAHFKGCEITVVQGLTSFPVWVNMTMDEVIQKLEDTGSD